MKSEALILIVDDDEGMRETLLDILSEEGYRVESAATGESALEKVSQTFYDLVLTDIRLPTISGIELLKDVKQASSDTMVVVMTGYASLDTSVEALNLGAEAYLIKPLNMEEAKMSIKRALDRQRLVLENRRLLERMKDEIRQKEALQTELIQSARLSSLAKLTAGISHEINNPLCAVLGYTQLLLGIVDRSSCDPKVKEALAVIERGGKRIARILENLDLYCRPSAGGRKEVDVNRAIENTISLIQTETDIMNIEIKRRFDPGLPRILADESGLMHVFINLMRNARDAMQNGGTLEISTSKQSKGKSIQVVFRDTGEGISEESLEGVFEPFFTTRDPGEGIGLGLSIAYEIVKENGGDIGIASQENRGTTVTITLPAHFKSRSGQGNVTGEEDKDEESGRRRRRHGRKASVSRSTSPRGLRSGDRGIGKGSSR